MNETPRVMYFSPEELRIADTQNMRVYQGRQDRPFLVIPLTPAHHIPDALVDRAVHTLSLLHRGAKVSVALIREALESLVPPETEASE